MGLSDIATIYFCICGIICRALTCSIYIFYYLCNYLYKPAEYFRIRATACCRGKIQKYQPMLFGGVREWKKDDGNERQKRVKVD
jgi:hypothetical protein